MFFQIQTSLHYGNENNCRSKHEGIVNRAWAIYIIFKYAACKLEMKFRMYNYPSCLHDIFVMLRRGIIIYQSFMTRGRPLLYCEKWIWSIKLKFNLKIVYVRNKLESKWDDAKSYIAHKVNGKNI